VQVSGRFSPHPRGFGFVDFDAEVAVPGPEGVRVTADSGFVPPELCQRWLADDRVTATVEVDDRERINVTALELVARPRRFLVGTVATFAGDVTVVPDPRLGSGRVPVAASMVASLTRVDSRQVVVMVGADDDGRARATNLVAGPTPPGAPAAIRARAITIAHGAVAPDVLDPGPADVGLSPAEALGTALRAQGQLASGRPGLAAGLDVEGEIPGRDLGGLDWRESVAVTIDDDRALDLDDALSAGWDGSPDSPVDLFVHIADPAGVVGIGSPADRYALTMGTTTYLAVGGNAPMLDPALSEDLVSLLPGQERGALTVSCQVSPDGGLSDVAVALSVIRSTARLSYAAVDAFLDGVDQRDLLAGAHGPSGASEEHLEPVAATVAALAEAARRLGVERDARDTMESLFEPATLEAAIVDGKIRAIPADPHPAAQQVVERLMVAANESVAGWAVEHDVPLLFRSHLGFDPERLARLRVAAEAAGVELPEPLQPADVLDAVARLRAAERGADADLLATAAAGAVARAHTSAEPSGHSGLASAAYTQFTSPIRRATDLVVHRQIRAALAEEPLPYGRKRLAALAGWLDARAGAAGHAQALERNALWAVLLDRGAVTWPATAVVTGLSSNGARIRIPAAGVSGMVPANRFDGDQRSLSVAGDGTETTDGAVRLGQRLSVRLDRLDALGRPDFRLA